MDPHTNNIPGRSEWRSKLLCFLLIVLLCAVIGEATARAFWRIQYSVPFRDPSLILYAFYPELRKVDAETLSHEDEYYDILLLAGSVLHRDWGTVEQELLEQLAYRGYTKVRVYNLSMPAHTSRDSLLKYKSFTKARFDLVVFYHGINETRANNVPSELFQEDYSHYSWYEIVNELFPYHNNSSLALSYTFDYIVTNASQMLHSDRYVPKSKPLPEWVRFGKSYGSAAALETNLRSIMDISESRGDQLLLMTFAIYVPDDYTSTAFKEKRLDYLLHISPISMWGDRENVVGAVRAHNEVIRRLAKSHAEVLFVDQDNLMLKEHGPYFNDPCHLTAVGSLKFVANMLTVVLPQLENSKWGLNLVD